MKFKVLKVLTLSLAVFSFGLLHAEVNSDDQVIKNERVVLHDGSYQEVSLAWSYRNASGGDVNYQQVLTNEAAADAAEAKYNSENNGVVNYLVKTNGDILATLESDEDVWTTFSRTASTHYGKKSYSIYDVPEAKSTVMIVDSYWQTTKLLAFKRNMKTNGEGADAWQELNSLTEITDINLKRLDPIYTKYLDKKYGPSSTATAAEKELYRIATHNPETGAPERRLGYTYKIDASLDRALAKQAGVDFLFVVTPRAEVPKGMANFTHSEQMFVGLKLSEDHPTKFLRVELTATQLIEK